MSDDRVTRSPLVRISDIATATDIASRCNVTAQCVWQWYARHEDLPRPFLHRTRLTLWRWSEVRAWWEGRQEGEHDHRHSVVKLGGVDYLFHA